RPDHRPVSRGFPKPRLVAERKYRACIVELNAHAVALARRQQGGLLVALAMSEIEYPIADTQRFTGGVHIAQPNHQIRNWPVGRDIERHDRGAKDLDRRIEWRGLENHGARVVVLLVAGLIAPATEWNPFARTLADRLRRAYGASRQRCRGFLQPLIGQEQPPRGYSGRWPRRFCNPTARQR